MKLRGNTLTVTKEEHDPKIKRQDYQAAGESHLLHHIKTTLNKAAGVDFLVKKRMWKDGHLMDDSQQYIKTARKGADVPHIYLFNNSWAMYGLDQAWHEAGECDLLVMTDVYGKGKTDDLQQLEAIIDRVNNEGL